MFQNFSKLSNSAKLVIAAGTGGGLMALGTLIPRNPDAFLLFLGGTVAVAVMIFVCMKLVALFSKMKAIPGLQRFLGLMSKNPTPIMDPGKIAELDRLQKKFEEGLDTFKKAGKSLYEFPWFLIVGEPGSGKTEAIRRCGIGFPPGLQDEFQGTGGTVNMNWWFTDHAVILDTAGKLMFNEVEAGQTSEWKELLLLLKKFRYNCPINGLFLAVPADSLIKDSADEIEKKASKIARQLDLIQRTLDVRFPVFVIITKSDLITGFRDFFNAIDDPGLQHQMFGWSNPSPLDEPYNSSFIDQQLKTIKGRLFRKRLALLHRSAMEDNLDINACQTESMYAFPYTLEKLAPRMSLYLEQIFSVGNKWSCKPLFFRGIYFTSSMQEGYALDQELADTLGMPVDKLPDGRVWARDRACFLKDLFMKKVFVEKGLVSRATNAARQHTQRKAIVLSVAILSVLSLIVFTLYGGMYYKKNIGNLTYFKYFKANDNYKPEFNYTKAFPEVAIDEKKTFKLVLDKELKAEEKDKKPNVTPIEFNLALHKAVQGWKKGPFQPIPDNKLRIAADNEYYCYVIYPLVKMACDQISNTYDPNEWNSFAESKQVPHDVRLLNHLFSIYKSGADKEKLNELYERLSKEQSGQKELSTLFEYCPPVIESSDKENILYASREQRKSELMVEINKAAEAKLSHFGKFWDPNSYFKTRTADIDQLANLLNQYDKIELEILKNDKSLEFSLRYEKLKDIKSKIDQCKQLRSLKGDYEKLKETAKSNVKSVFLEIPKELTGVTEAQKMINDGIDGYINTKESNVEKLDSLFLGEPNYADRFEIYEIIYFLKTSSDNEFCQIIHEGPWKADAIYEGCEEKKPLLENPDGRSCKARAVLAEVLNRLAAPKDHRILEAYLEKLGFKYNSGKYLEFKAQWDIFKAEFPAVECVKTFAVTISNYEKSYMDYWCGSYVIDEISKIISVPKTPVPEWNQQKEFLNKLSLDDTKNKIEDIITESDVACHRIVTKQLKYSNAENENFKFKVKNWRDTYYNQNYENVKKALLALPEGEFVDSILGKKKPSSFQDAVQMLYIRMLVNNTLKSLNKTERNRAEEKEKEITQALELFPFTNIQKEMETDETINNRFNRLKELIKDSKESKPAVIPIKPFDIEIIGSSEYEILSQELDKLGKDIQKNYSGLTKTEEQWMREGVLQNAQQKLKNIPDQCVISTYDNKNEKYKYLEIWYDKSTMPLDGSTRVLLSAPVTSEKMEWPWRDVKIFCQEGPSTPESWLVKQYSGQWSLIKMYYEYCKEPIQASQTCNVEMPVVVKDNPTKDKVKLKLVFSKK